MVHLPKAFWLTGLSGVAKTTLAKEFMAKGIIVKHNKPYKLSLVLNNYCDCFIGYSLLKPLKLAKICSEKLLERIALTF